MIIKFEEAIANMRRDIERWKRELAECEKANVPEIARVVQRWIEEGERLIDGVK